MRYRIHQAGRSCPWPVTPVSSLLLVLTAWALCVSAPVAAEIESRSTHDADPSTIPSLRITRSAEHLPALAWRAGVQGGPSPASSVSSTTALFDHSAFHQVERKTGLLGRYRSALVRESRRTLRREPYLFWVDGQTDEQDEMFLRAQRKAERIFGKAHNRMLSDLADTIVESSAKLRAARRYIEDFDLDFRSDGADRRDAVAHHVNVTSRSLSSISSAREYDTRVRFVVSSRPRVRLTTWLPGKIRARVTLPLTTAGIHTSLSRGLTSNLYGTLDAGFEDGGDESWISAGLQFQF